MAVGSMVVAGSILRGDDGIPGADGAVASSVAASSVVGMVDMADGSASYSSG
jgi:hypothetical protein